MNDWLLAQGLGGPAAGLWAGFLLGLLVAVVLAWAMSRRAAAAERSRLEPELALRQERAEWLQLQVHELERHRDVLEMRTQERETQFGEQIRRLEEAEQRLSAHFERLAARIFEERSDKFADLNRKQIDALLAPLGEKLVEFRNTVTDTHKHETAQHQVLQAKLKELEQLNVRLHEDATHLARALTSSAKAQGSWGEQQLERLLNLAGLEAGREYSTQVSLAIGGGQRAQPDLVLHLPEGRSIVMDSKVSLNAWVRYQAETDEELRLGHLRDHVQALRNHVRSLADKRYTEIADLQALDFVLMFVPIEAALIEAVQADPELPAFALERKVALVSPTNLLVTLRTVASVWTIYKQNTNALEIATRAGLLYDKFAGFVANLQMVGERMRQAQHSYDEAFSQLSTGSGNLLRQAELLKVLGARQTKQIDTRLLERSRTDEAGIGKEPEGPEEPEEPEEPAEPEEPEEPEEPAEPPEDRP